MYESDKKTRNRARNFLKPKLFSSPNSTKNQKLIYLKFNISFSCEKEFILDFTVIMLSKHVEC